MSTTIKIKRTKINKTPFFVIGIIVLINLFGLYLMIRHVNILYISAIVIALIILDIAKRYYSYQQSESTGIIKEYERDLEKGITFYQFFALVKRQYRINRRYIIASGLGLILAILVISQIFLLNASYNQASFDRYVNLSNPQTFQMSATGIDTNELKNEWFNRIDSEYERLLSDFGFEVTHIYSYTQVISSVLLGQEISEPTESIIANTFQFKTYQWTEQELKFLKIFPSFNKSMEFDPDERFLIIPVSLKFGTQVYTIDDVIKNGSIPILADDAVSPSLDPTSFENFTYPITNYWRPTQDDYQFLVDNNLFQMKDRLSKGLYLPKDEGWNFLQKWKEVVDNNPKIAFKFRSWVLLKTDIYTEIPFFDSLVLEEYQAKILEAITPLKSWGNLWASDKNDGTDLNVFVSVFSPLDLAIRNYQESIGSLKEFLVLISAPLIAISLYLVSFSLNMVAKRKENIISIMKTRGTANSQLHYMLASEIMLSGIIASIVGMILSIPWTVLSLRTVGFFEYTENTIVDLIIGPSWFIYVPIYGFLISFDLHIMSILTVDRITTDVDLNKINNTIKPMWQEMYLDVILFILGIIYWIVLSNAKIGRAEVTDFLLYDIGPYVLAMMMVSGPVMFQRFYYPILSTISSVVTFFVPSKSVQITKKNVSLHRVSTSRLAALLTAGFILAILTISIPYSFDQWSNETARYEHGADVLIEGLYDWEIERYQYFDIPEIESFSPIIKLDFNIFSAYQPDIGRVIPHYRILGIDPQTFEDVAFWQEYYSEYELSEIVNSLKEPHSIGMSRQTKEGLGLKFGDVINLPMINFDAELFDLKINTEFDYFPNIITTTPEVSSYGQVRVNVFELVMSTETAKQVVEYYQMSYNPMYYIKPAEGYTAADTKLALQETFKNDASIIITDISDRYINLFDKEQFQLINSTLEGFLILSILISLIAFSYFVFLNIKDRQSEMGLYRVLGMSNRQFRKLFMTEGLFLVGITNIVGTVLGAIISSNFFLVITSNSRANIPPIRFLLDIPELLILLTTMLVITYLASLIPSIIISRREAGNLLRSI